MDEHASDGARNAFGGSANADGVDLPDLPQGYVGPVFLPGTGREIWWTGRVAIGLRYTNTFQVTQTGRGEVWLQSLLLRPRAALQIGR